MSGIPELEHKTLTACGVKTLDEEKGIVEAFVAGIGNKDSVKDIIVKGAFVESLKVRKPKGVWSHDWNRPVSKTLDIYEVPAGDPRLPQKMLDAGIGGLYVKTQFNLETQDGRDALSWVKFYDDESEWSIGYQTKQSEYDTKQKANLLKEIDLYEYSPVLFGANPLTSTVGVKVLIGEGQEKAIDLKLEGVDDETAARIKAAVEEALNSEEPEVKATEENASPDETQEPPATEAKGEEVKPEEEETTPEPEEKSEPAATDSGAGQDDAGSAGTEGDDVPGGSEKSDEWVPAPVVEYVEKMLASADLSPRDAQAIKTFVGTRVRATDGIYPDGTKTLPGSFEEKHEEICEALSDMYPGGSAYIVATFDDKIVYRVYNYMTGEGSYYQASYSVVADDDNDGSFEIKITDPQEVEIVETIVAKIALTDAVFKGHGLEIKKLLKPLVDLSEDAEDDEDIKSVLEFVLKAGASLSASNKKKIQDAIDAIDSAQSALTALISPEEKTDEVELIDVGNKAAACGPPAKSAEAEPEAEIEVQEELEAGEKADEASEEDSIAADLAEFKSLLDELETS